MLSRARSAVAVRCGRAGSVAAAVRCHLGCQIPLWGPCLGLHGVLRSRGWVEKQVQRPPRIWGHSLAQTPGAVCSAALLPGMPAACSTPRDPGLLPSCRYSLPVPSVPPVPPALGTCPRTARLLRASFLLMPPSPSRHCAWSALPSCCALAGAVACPSQRMPGLRPLVGGSPRQKTASVCVHLGAC